MKRSKILKPLATLTVLLGLLLGGALIAQDNPPERQNQQTLQERNQFRNQVSDGENLAGPGMNFIDEDGNGICDRFEHGQNMHQNMGRNMGRGMGHGQHFMDEDGDGICDYRSGSDMNGGGMHRGGGYGHRSGQGHGAMGPGRNR